MLKLLSIRSGNWVRADCVKQQAKIQIKAKRVLSFSCGFCLFKMAEGSFVGSDINFNTRNPILASAVGVCDAR